MCDTIVEAVTPKRITCRRKQCALPTCRERELLESWTVPTVPDDHPYERSQLVQVFHPWRRDGQRVPWYLGRVSRRWRTSWEIQDLRFGTLCCHYPPDLGPVEERLGLVAFLRECIAEDRERAQGTGVIAWLTYRESDGSMRYTTVASGSPKDGPEVWSAGGQELTGYDSAAVVYDQTRLLRWCDAAERIVDACERELPPSWVADSDHAFYEPEAAEVTLRLLAAYYSDRPGFRQEWAQ